MKKTLSITFVSTILLSLASSPVNAAYNFTQNSGLASMGAAVGLNTTVSTPESYIGLILTLFFSILSIVFLILIIYSGINWMTAQGNSSQVEKAKDTLTHSIVGLVVVMISYGITFFVMSVFRAN